MCNKLENQFNTFKWISTCRKLQAIQSKDRRHRPKCPRLYLNSILCCSIKCILIWPVPWLYISATFWFGNKSALCAISGVWWHIECWRQTFCMYVAGSLYFIGLVRYIICRLRTFTFCMCLLARCRWTWRCTARCGSSWVGTCSGQTPEPCPCSSGHQSSYTRPPPRSPRGSYYASAAEL